MPAYHSSLSAPKEICKMALLPINTKYRGPAPPGTGDADIIDESLQYFKANVFFKEYEIKSAADRVLIYITLYITECLKKLQKCPSKNAAVKEMNTLGIENFSIPGEPNFPLNALYQKPADRNEADTLRQYMTQIRQETGARIIEKVFDPVTDKPSKWWMCFTKKKFMDKSLSAPGF
ncbi:actin-related protein 2/3 complex subunit 3-like isoform X2 [Anneissia japonica]|uniref:actin-related protein 2/3 complex subunit 3-like isoform X1 n=1 Tax=Anneissia japonica TaxID=1529436 RepID=UPI0014256714|nr:actin-related protein 2/3 complex subunit 3-like isoform X1 [Anneissia japonica]XP_033113507.1 actin-related protein 2/3 complex subunit 3-like isoform X2 [Anneissia japonica]